MKRFGLWVIGFGVFVLSVFGLYGLLYAMQTGNAKLAYWLLLVLLAVGIGAFVLALVWQYRINQIQQQLDAVLLERDGLQQRLDLVLSERDELQKQFYKSLSERDELQKQFYQVLSERDGLLKRIDYVQLLEGLSDKEQAVLYLSKQDHLTLEGIEKLTGIPDRTISDIKKSLRGKGLLS
ncbi:MAG: hypothetical protein WHX52_18465 [Anaerolineae bacterium]|mgnify:CR=1 FL=1